MIQVLILAEGLGNRMKPLTDRVPKPMLLIDGVPFLELLIKYLVKHSITDIVIGTSYLAHKIEDYFGDGSKWGVKIRYSNKPQPMGTAGCIKYAEELLNDRFLVLNGDSYSKIDFKLFKDFHENNDHDVTISLTHTHDASRYGLVELEDNLIKRFREKTKESFSGHINAGYYMMNKSVLDLINKDEFVSLEEVIFPKLVSEQKLGGYVFDGYFIDIGTFESYYKFIDDYKNKII